MRDDGQSLSRLATLLSLGLIEHGSRYQQALNRQEDGYAHAVIMAEDHLNAIENLQTYMIALRACHAVSDLRVATRMF